MQLGPFQHLDLGPDGKVRRINGAEVKDTEITAYRAKVRGVGTSVEMDAFCLHPEQLRDARRDIEKAFPLMKGKMVLSPTPEGLTLGTLATSDWWFVVDGRVSFHPLTVRILAIDNQVRRAFEPDLLAHNLTDLV